MLLSRCHHIHTWIFLVPFRSTVEMSDMRRQQPEACFITEKYNWFYDTVKEQADWHLDTLSHTQTVTHAALFNYSSSTLITVQRTIVRSKWRNILYGRMRELVLELQKCHRNSMCIHFCYNNKCITTQIPLVACDNAGSDWKVQNSLYATICCVWVHLVAEQSVCPCWPVSMRSTYNRIECIRTGPQSNGRK